MITQNRMHDYHIFRFSKGDIAAAFEEDVFREIIATDAFRRLSSVHFLGSIDYLLTTGSRGVEERQTRYDHSLGVAQLAKRFALLRNAPHKEYLEIVVAALLHDIGHAPLSHSLEPAFKSIFELDHHLVGERILRGEVKIGVKLSKVLRRHQINNFEVMSLVSGLGLGLGKDLFSRAINVDTIEGIIRSASYLMRKEIVVSPISVIDAFSELGAESQQVLDEFWLLKNMVYTELIQSDRGLVADFMCKRYMEINRGEFSTSYYYGTEQALRHDHSLLFEVLDDFGRSGRISPKLIRDGEELKFTRRRFYIDASVPLRTYADIDRRYLQSKEKAIVKIRKSGGELAHSIPEHPKLQNLF